MRDERNFLGNAVEPIHLVVSIDWTDRNCFDSRCSTDLLRSVSAQRQSLVWHPHLTSTSKSFSASEQPASEIFQKSAIWFVTKATLFFLLSPSASSALCVTEASPVAPSESTRNSSLDESLHPTETEKSSRVNNKKRCIFNTQWQAKWLGKQERFDSESRV